MNAGSEAVPLLCSLARVLAAFQIEHLSQHRPGVLQISIATPESFAALERSLGVASRVCSVPELGRAHREFVAELEVGDVRVEFNISGPSWRCPVADQVNFEERPMIQRAIASGRELVAADIEHCRDATELKELEVALSVGTVDDEVLFAHAFVAAMDRIVELTAQRNAAVTAYEDALLQISTMDGELDRAELRIRQLLRKDVP